MTRYASLAVVIAGLVCAGCGGLPAGGGRPADTATVVVTVGPAGTNQPLDVEAVVICGGVRATYRPAEGWVTLKNVPLGTETPPRQPLTVTAQGYRTAAQLLVLNVTAATYVDVELTPVNLAETGTVTGSVKDVETDKPIVNANVQFSHGTAAEQAGNEEHVVEGFTDAEGQFVIGGIPVGLNTVKVGAAGYLEVVRQVTVVQDEGGQNPVLEFALLSGAAKIEVRGVVIDLATQLPVAGATVSLGDQAVVTGSNGSFSIPEVPVGQRDLVVKADGYDEYRQTLNVVPGIGRLRIEIVEAAPNPPPPPHNVSGTVEIRNRPNNSGAKVSAYNLRAGQVMGEDTTKADGRYYLLVPPGEYEIRVNFEGQELVRQLTVPGGGRVVSGIDFIISAPPL